MILTVLSACASEQHYVEPSRYSTSLTPLISRSNADDKQAQMLLGLMFAEGKAVEKNCKLAKRLLRKAASQSGGTMWVYVPSGISGKAGQVVPFEQGPLYPGLRSARDALKGMESCD